MVAVDLITGRHASQFSTSGAVHGLYAYNRRKKRVEALTARATVLRPAARDGPISFPPRPAERPATDRHGLAGGLPDLQHGVHAVPPDLLYNLQVKNFLITEAVRGRAGS